MLFRAARLATPGHGLVFLVLPRACLANSRYLTMFHVRTAIMKPLGLALVSHRTSPKLSYSVWQRRGGCGVGDDGTDEGEKTASIRKRRPRPGRDGSTEPSSPRRVKLRRDGKKGMLPKERAVEDDPSDICDAHDEAPSDAKLITNSCEETGASCDSNNNEAGRSNDDE